MSQQYPTPETIKAGRHYVIATDGACIPNPGPGGWGLIKQLKDGCQLLQQGANAGRSKQLKTTNNKMELMAAIMAVESVREPETPAIIRTDSNYVLQSFTLWLPRWKTNGWKGSNGAVLNRELWERLDAACAAKTIFWEKVKGHSGDDLNDLADMLANNAALDRYPHGQRSVQKLHPKLFRTRAEEA